MRVRFLADENFSLSRHIVRGLKRREAAIDIVRVVDVGLSASPDAAILEFAASESQVLLTHGVRTIPGHFGRFVESSISAGVILVPQSAPPGATIENLLTVWFATKPEQWSNLLFWMPDDFDLEGLVEIEGEIPR